MEPTKQVFSLYLDTLKGMPHSIIVNEGLVFVDNTDTPHVTLLTDAWKNNPAQVDAVMTLFCLEGSMRVRIALKEYHMTRNSVCIIIPGTIVEILSVSKDFRCISLAMDKSYLNLEQSYTLEIMQLVKYLQRQACYSLQGTYATRYRDTFLEALKTAYWEDNPLRENMLKSYVYLLYCCLYPVLEDKGRSFEETRGSSQQKEIYFRFVEMLQQSYREHRNVAYYAEALGITPKYLSKVVHAESGQTALRWIEDFVLLEAKALLKQKNTSIQSVAEHLNFPDQSSFGKFFKRLTNQSPKEYNVS